MGGWLAQLAYRAARRNLQRGGWDKLPSNRRGGLPFPDCQSDTRIPKHYAANHRQPTCYRCFLWEQFASPFPCGSPTTPRRHLLEQAAASQ